MVYYTEPRLNNGHAWFNMAKLSQPSFDTLHRPWSTLLQPRLNTVFRHLTVLCHGSLGYVNHGQ